MVLVHYSEPVPNADIFIISLSKIDKILMLAKILFLTSFRIFVMEILYIEMHCTGGNLGNYHEIVIT